MKINDYFSSSFYTTYIMSLNKAMLIGNVGKDPEVRYLDGNQSQAGQQPVKVASFTLATTERYRDRNNEVRENTEWHNIVAWRSQADFVEKYVKKGTSLFVEGRIRTRSWDDQSGNKRYITEIVADNLQFVGRKPEGQGTAPAPTAQSAPAQQTYQRPAFGQSSYNQPAGFQPAAQPVTEDPGDDLPF